MNYDEAMKLAKAGKEEGYKYLYEHIQNTK